MKKVEPRRLGGFYHIGNIGVSHRHRGFASARISTHKEHKKDKGAHKIWKLGGRCLRDYRHFLRARFKKITKVRKRTGFYHIEHIGIHIGT
jgi:hypothetical protein